MAIQAQPDLAVGTMPAPALPASAIDEAYPSRDTDRLDALVAVATNENQAMNHQ